MAPGELWLARFPMGGAGGAKARPVLVLTGALGSVPEFVVAYVSSVIPQQLLPTDILLDPSTPEHASTNLSVTSILRLHTISTIHQRDLFRRTGICDVKLFQDVQSKLRAVLNL